jgi:hypothetical protein
MRAAATLGLLLLFAVAVHGQSNVVVEVDDVTDNRFSSTDTGGFQMTGGLELRVKLDGKNLDKAEAARVIVKEATDDKGNSLLDASRSAPDFMARNVNGGLLQMQTRQPARTATTVRIKGTVELYVPSRDPNAYVKVEKALAKLDAPLASKALKAAKLDLTPLSPAGYAAAKKARKITPEDIEKIRAEAKKQGAPEKEIEMAIELAQAFDSMDGDASPNAVILSGKKSDFDRIFKIEVLGEDGKPLDDNGRSVSSRGDASLVTLNLSTAPPANAALQLMLVTDKARVSFPFELKVQLP